MFENIFRHNRIKNQTSGSDRDFLTVDSADGWLIGSMGGQMNKTTAMKISAVSACVDIISNSMAKLPIQVKDNNTKKPIENALGRLLSERPNEAMAPAVYKKLLEVYRLLSGNAYVLMVRSSRTGEITELLPLPTEFTNPVFDETGVLWYLVTMPRTGEMRRFRSYEVLHFKNFTYDGITGVSTLQRAADVISNARQAQRYEGAFYLNSARPSGVLYTDTAAGAPTMINGPQKEIIRKEWNKIHSGADNAFRIAVLDLGLRYQQIGMSNADAQFIENKAVTVEEIARFFTIPLYKINAGKQSYSSNEQNAIEYVSSTLQPIVEQYEEEYGYKGLFEYEKRRGAKVMINMMAELRGDYNSRSNWYTKMRLNGAFSVDDILELEDMPPVPGGHVRLASLNYAPLDKFEELSIERNTKGGDS